MLNPLNQKLCKSGACLAVVAAMLADMPAAHAQRPQLYESRSFQVLTDLPPGDSRQLVRRLDSMLRLVSAYFGRPLPRQMKISMYVIDDFANWPANQLATMNQEGLDAVRKGGGLCITEVLRNQVNGRFVGRANVYAGADHGTPQHEAVHAYCGLAFGELGPVWYAEGMAEVGQYWRENDRSVNADEIVIEYLQSEDPKPLDAIVNNPLETTGDSWKNYSWRWVLCHLLGFNENYTQRFKPLGMKLLSGEDVDFWQVYGTQAPEIEFEYRLFLQDLAPGYRCDLCSWDWSTRFRGLQGSAAVASGIHADRGWQASRLKVFKDETYSFTATGDWKLEGNGDDVTADGNDEGAGRLVGVVFSDYTLSEPFDLGSEGTFTATQDGNLFLRCRDDWGAIADNNGIVRVRLTIAKEEEHATE